MSEALAQIRIAHVHRTRIPVQSLMAAEFTDDVFFSTIAELNTRLKAKEFTAVELVRAFAQRLEQLGPRYNALALAAHRGRHPQRKGGG